MKSFIEAPQQDLKGQPEIKDFVQDIGLPSDLQSKD